MCFCHDRVVVWPREDHLQTAHKQRAVGNVVHVPFLEIHPYITGQQTTVVGREIRREPTLNGGDVHNLSHAKLGSAETLVPKALACLVYSQKRCRDLLPRSGRAVDQSLHFEADGYLRLNGHELALEVMIPHA